MIFGGVSFAANRNKRSLRTTNDEFSRYEYLLTSDMHESDDESESIPFLCLTSLFRNSRVE
jgi:hypothetical protein